MANIKFDWEKVYIFYLRSGASLQQVSDLLGIPYQSVRRQAGTEKWISHQDTLKRVWEEGKKAPVYPFTPDELIQFFKEWNATNGGL